jgi:hypothetical protein
MDVQKHKWTDKDGISAEGRFVLLDPGQDGHATKGKCRNKAVKLLEAKERQVAECLVPGTLASTAILHRNERCRNKAVKLLKAKDRDVGRSHCHAAEGLKNAGPRPGWLCYRDGNAGTKPSSY